MKSIEGDKLEYIKTVNAIFPTKVSAAVSCANVPFPLTSPVSTHDTFRSHKIL